MAGTDPVVLKQNVRDDLSRSLDGFGKVLDQAIQSPLGPLGPMFKENMLGLLESVDGVPSRADELIGGMLWALPRVQQWLDGTEAVVCGHGQLSSCGCTDVVKTRREILWG
jgi:hypothetical protein